MEGKIASEEERADGNDTQLKEAAGPVERSALLNGI